MVAKRPQCQYSGQSLVVRYEPDASTCVNAIASYTSLHVLSHPSSKVRSSTSKISVAAACLATLGVRGHQIKNNLYMAFCQPKRWAFFHHTKDPRVKMQSPTYHSINQLHLFVVNIPRKKPYHLLTCWFVSIFSGKGRNVGCRQETSAALIGGFIARRCLSLCWQARKPNWIN